MDDQPDYGRRKRGGYIWRNDLQRMRRMAEETRRAILDMVLSGKLDDANMAKELMNKMESIEETTRQLEQYGEGD